MPPTLHLRLALAGLCALGAQAQEQVRCAVDYGGEVRNLSAGPSADPYQVGSTAIGSYFLFRIVFETVPRETAAIKLYTYADRDEGPTLIHQASYPYPLRSQSGRYGFTGLQTVYEPMRDGELQYWCHLEGK
ncbi:hypothetical protein [Chitinimonas taiwanensis]|uniref:Uncharacterized protein n=1 Tax=Chitinimonas taiwanensis DSM 18899 TaxID=1121279 RepID=A0A1K2HBH6_9NEIS|nr:hypothetical protein [Chitinimonas taiwanensis]SFZ74160.1 hypothetical protein SAMN02745887_01138 [Chitinimonas taiwanensis DSM 18899]